MDIIHMKGEEKRKTDFDMEAHHHHYLTTH